MATKLDPKPANERPRVNHFMEIDPEMATIPDITFLNAPLKYVNRNTKIIGYRGFELNSIMIIIIMNNTHEINTKINILVMSFNFWKTYLDVMKQLMIPIEYEIVINGNILPAISLK